jgi:hypothetical protein
MRGSPCLTRIAAPAYGTLGPPPQTNARGTTPTTCEEFRTLPILKNADRVPPEVPELKEIRQTEDLLQGIQDEHEKYKAIKRLSFRIMQLNARRNGRVDNEIPQHYVEKLVERVEKK